MAVALATDKKPDFTGIATKAGLKCSDGRVIMPDAFKHMDGMKVPLIWQHGAHDVNNVLGYALLKAVNGDIVTHAYFNDSESGKKARVLVQHGDVESLSIRANKLVERAKQVFHGVINEVSIVLQGANPGAKIQNVALEHADGSIDELDDEALIFTGLPLEEVNVTHADEDDESGPTIEEVYETLNDVQKEVVHAMIGAAIEAAGETAQHSDDTNDEGDLEHTEGSESMTRNVFENQGKDDKGVTHGGDEGTTFDVTPEVVKEIVQSAISNKGGSLMAAARDYALEHGIRDIEVLFPEARNVTTTPDFDKRRTEWVSDVLASTKKLPWTRIKNIVADLTQDEARARGYIKGNLKKEEWFGLISRSTTPTTVYKKQSLDRDDIIDITDFDVVNWLWGEMRLMIDEEVARAILIGDGRPVEDPANPGQPNPDKIKDPQGAAEGAGIRSILHDDDLFAATVTLPAGGTPAATVDGVVEQMGLYKGTGTPALYTTRAAVTRLMLARDGMGRRLYRTKAELADELMVSRIVEVEVMESEPTVFGIVVNLADYSVGTDRGGQIATFDDFDIDYNKYKYLIETRLSGALTKIRSALVIKWAEEGDVNVAPAEPAFNGTQVTIVDQAGVVYRNGETNVVMNAAGSPYAVAEGDSLMVTAEPANGYFFDNNVEDEWVFTNEA